MKSDSHYIERNEKLFSVKQNDPLMSLDNWTTKMIDTIEIDYYKKNWMAAIFIQVGWLLYDVHFFILFNSIHMSLNSIEYRSRRYSFSENSTFFVKKIKKKIPTITSDMNKREEKSERERKKLTFYFWHHQWSIRCQKWKCWWW